MHYIYDFSAPYLATKLAGVDITLIALWLGHESIQTTHGYIEADLATKEQVLEKVAPAGQKVRRFKADDALLRFLATL